jgi:phenylalanyl-tRNA synthetase beta chain
VKVPIEWLRDVVTLPADLSTEAIADRLTAFDLKLEEIVASGISGPLTVGRVLTVEAEEQKNGKTINWCSVDVGPELNVDGEPRGIVCGAHNFDAGDLVVVSLPGTVLPALAQYIPGGLIAARKTYGHVSDGMICSRAELGLSGDSDGIIVLAPDAAAPGDSAITLLGLDADVIDLEVNPDRAYALSLRGVGRDTALAFGVPFDDPANVTRAVEGSSHPVVVDDPEACPVFTAREVTGFDPARPTPEWMVRRIEQAGMRSISLAVDVSNYVMLELGQPNHAYDKAKLRGAISVRRAKPGEKLTTLDDVERSLDPDDVVICDERGPIGIGGVMGGADVEIDGSTTDIVIECAYFDPPVIARSARRHKLPSEASKRFERGVDPQLAVRASQRVADLLVEFGGGSASAGVTVVGEAPARASVSAPLDLSSRVIGIDIDADTVTTALRANGIEVEIEGETMRATPPSWRFDLNDPYDLVEEVLRVVGYDRVPSVLPPAPAGRGLTKAQRLRRRAGFVLAGEGLVEVKTFPFAGPADFDRLGLEADDPRRGQVLLENPLSAEEPGMTTTLLVGLLKAVALNLGRGHSDVALVETARVYVPGAGGADAPIYGVDRRPTEAELAALDAALPAQPWHVGFVLAGGRESSGWYGSGRPAGWADAIEIVRVLAAAFHVDLVVEAADIRPWHPGRAAAILVAGNVIGHAGELHPRVARAWGLPERTVAAELDLDALVAAAPELGPRPEFSSFPVAKEDLAFVVANSVTAEAVRQALVGASDLIESVRLFDVYTGDQVGEGRRSLAFALRLRAPDRTLSEDDIRGAREAAISAASELGATLRT